MQTQTLLTAPKRKGEYVEALFLSRAIALGYNVCKPWGDSTPYDFILERDGRTLNIQVRSIWKKLRWRYPLHLTGFCRTRRLSQRDIAFLIAYVVPEDVWYVIPVSGFPDRPMTELYPHV